MRECVGGGACFRIDVYIMFSRLQKKYILINNATAKEGGIFLNNDFQNNYVLNSIVLTVYTLQGNEMNIKENCQIMFYLKKKTVRSCSI